MPSIMAWTFISIHKPSHRCHSDGRLFTNNYKNLSFEVLCCALQLDLKSFQLCNQDCTRPSTHSVKMIKPKLTDDPKEYLSQIITNLQSSSKNGRKQALQKMNYEIFENPTNRDTDLTVVFPAVHTYVLKSFADDSEACRDLAIRIVANFIDTLPLNDFYLTYITPVLVRRVGCPEIVEESEELRLSLVTLVRNIVEKYKSTSLLLPFFNDLTCILTKTCMDPYPKVKREACETVILLSNVLKRDFHMQSESFVKPALSNFAHQHFRVRVTAIQCIGAIVMNGNAKCFEQSITPMAEKLFDENAQVRMQVTREVGNWMLSLRDRYSFWHRMIPLLLTSLSDAIADIRTEAENLWKNIGLQYMDENEEELKKKTDFLTDVPLHYPDVTRPNMGCRTLVQRNIGKIVPAIARELDGWQADARLRSSQLLCWLILCAEEGGTQHSNTIVRAMLRGAKDDDTRVTVEIKRASELFGYFILPETWWPLIRPELDSWGSLFVLANVLKGTHPSCLHATYLKEIVRELVDPDRCQTRKKNYQLNLLRVTEALMDVFKEDCNIVYDQIFIICFTVYAMAFDNDTQFHAFSNLDKLRYLEKCGKSTASLYEKHIHKILSNITSEANTWTLVSADRCLLQAVMQHAGSALAHNLHLLAPLLKESVASDVDAEVKLKIFTGLSSVMLKKQTAFEKTGTDKLEAFLRIVLEEVIMPNLVWSPGRTAEAIRTAALACLCSVLQTDDLDEGKLAKNESGDATEDSAKLKVVLFPSKESLEPFLTEILPLATSLVDDNSNLTRQYALRALRNIALLAQEKECFTSDILNKTYFAVLKRLDDSNDKVRSFAVQTLRTFFNKLPRDYNLVTSNAHIDALYSAMLIHLDDMEEPFRKEMLDAILELSSVDPSLLKRKVHANMQLYRNKAAYVKLAEHIDKMSL